MKTLTKEMQATVTPHQAIELLKEGNKRFVNNLKVNRNLLQQVNETSGGQFPLAVILSCIDSRTSAELIFDQGLWFMPGFLFRFINCFRNRFDCHTLFAV